jgi:hypothetical protein
LQGRTNSYELVRKATPPSRVPLIINDLRSYD